MPPEMSAPGDWLYIAAAFDEIDSIIVVLLNACGDGKYIGIKNDVLCRKTQFLREELIASRADLDFLRGVCLASSSKAITMTAAPYFRHSAAFARKSPHLLLN